MLVAARWPQPETPRIWLQLLCGSASAAGFLQSSDAGPYLRALGARPTSDGRWRTPEGGVITFASVRGSPRSWIPEPPRGYDAVVVALYRYDASVPQSVRLQAEAVLAALVEQGVIRVLGRLADLLPAPER